MQMGRKLMGEGTLEQARLEERRNLSGEGMMGCESGLEVQQVKRRSRLGR